MLILYSDGERAWRDSTPKGKKRKEKKVRNKRSFAHQRAPNKANYTHIN